MKEALDGSLVVLALITRVVCIAAAWRRLFLNVLQNETLIPFEQDALLWTKEHLDHGPDLLLELDEIYDVKLFAN